MMTERRRSTPASDSPRRRREDEATKQVAELQEYARKLEELNRRGSQGFRHYRVGSFVAFFILAVANAFGFYLIDHNAKVARDNLARETANRAAVLAEQAKATAAQSEAACRRTRRLFPPLLDGFERTGVLKGADLEFYRSSIPKSC